jgi:hypothetical protein
MSLPAAFELVKAMQAQGLDWGEGYRPLGRQAVAEIIESKIATVVGCWLKSLEARNVADQRNGSYLRWPLTELGDIMIAVVDGTKGFPEAIEAVFPRTIVQTCDKILSSAAGRTRSEMSSTRSAKPTKPQSRPTCTPS